MRELKSFSDIYKYLRDLESLEIKSAEDLNDLRTYYATSMILFNILNKIIEVGEKIALDNGYYPSSYREIFRILKDIGKIDEDLYKDLDWLVRLRNKIAHRYGEVTKGDLFQAIIMIKDVVRRLIKQIGINEKD